MEKDMETSTFFSVFQLMKFMQYQSMKRMEKMDLKPSQAGVLFSLKHWGEQSQKQLAERVGITPPSMTVALRKMEEKGYVTRRQDEKDQRVVKIHLAPKGEECIEGIQRVICEMEEIVYQGISRDTSDEAPSDRNEKQSVELKGFQRCGYGYNHRKDMSIGTWEFLIIEYTDGTG